MTPSSGKEIRVLRVLQVEDNAGDVRLIAEALQKWGMAVEVNVVPDESQAMEYLHRKEQFAHASRPDLVLLDLNLPRKGRQEVLAEIKSGPALKTIPVIVLKPHPLRAYELHAKRMNERNARLS